MPKNCHFCCSHDFWTQKRYFWRGRDVKKVVDEIEFLINTYGIHSIYMMDNSYEDSCTDDYQRVWDIAEEIIKRKIYISYHANFRGEFHRKASPQLMEILKRSGLISVNIGIESGNDEDLKIYGKTATLQDNLKIIDLFKSYGIHIDIGFINFNPYSSIEGLHKNINFLEEYKYASLLNLIDNRIMVFKGSYLYLKLKQDGLLQNGIYNELKYRFVDDRIGRLADFFRAYYKSVQESTNYNTVFFHTQKYLYIIDNLKRHLGEYMKDTTLNIV